MTGAGGPEADGPVSKSPPPAAPGKSRVKAIFWWVLRIGGTGAAFAYIASIVDLEDLKNAIFNVAPWAFLAACATTGVNLFVGAARWRILLAAYGAPNRPSIPFLARVYLVGFFYNNFLPGGVGGDVVRGIVTRRSFGARGATASMTVVLVERALGLSGLLLLVSGATILWPLRNTSSVLPFAAIGLVIAACGVASVAAGRRLAPLLPGRLGMIAASLPVIERFGPFFGALAISLVTQGLVALSGWFLLSSVTDGAVSLTDAFVLVPLAMAAAYFPLSVGGAGVREGAFVAIGTAALGMTRADALAASVALWMTQLAVSSLGGIWQLVSPIPGDTDGPGGDP